MLYLAEIQDFSYSVLSSLTAALNLGTKVNIHWEEDEPADRLLQAEFKRLIKLISIL